MKDDKIIFKHFRIPGVYKVPRKSSAPEKLLHPWIPGVGFDPIGFPFAKRFLKFPHPTGGKTTCNIYTPTGDILHGETNCSCSQVFHEDSGEDISLNRANLARGHRCSYCSGPVLLAQQLPDIHISGQAGLSAERIVQLSESLKNKVTDLESEHDQKISGS